MSLYAVGDLQGCLLPLKALLEHVSFDPTKDTLWLTGDLVNRGPDSIGCLSFVQSLGSSARTVLGNHDLHLIAVHHLKLKTKDEDIKRTLAHPDAPALLDWLVQQPLLIRDKERKLIMTHAGIPPNWSDKQASKYAKEVEEALSKVPSRRKFLNVMYGNNPYQWHNNLSGVSRLRYIVNAYTRMRFCNKEGKLEFSNKSVASKPPKNMLPWFAWPKKRKHRIIFGHWAALMGKTGSDMHVGLDTGYVWGNHLTLMNVDTNVRYFCDTNGNITEQYETE